MANEDLQDEPNYTMVILEASPFLLKSLLNDIRMLINMWLIAKSDNSVTILASSAFINAIKRTLETFCGMTSRTLDNAISGRHKQIKILNAQENNNENNQFIKAALENRITYTVKRGWTTIAFPLALIASPAAYFSSVTAPGQSDAVISSMNRFFHSYAFAIPGYLLLRNLERIVKNTGQTHLLPRLAFVSLLIETSITGGLLFFADFDVEAFAWGITGNYYLVSAGLFAYLCSQPESKEYIQNILHVNPQVLEDDVLGRNTVNDYIENFKNTHQDLAQVKSEFKLLGEGLLIGLQYSIEVGSLLWATYIMGKVSDVALAAYHINAQYRSMLTMSLFSIGTAVSTYVGERHMNEDDAGAQQYGNKALILGTGLSSLVCLLFSTLGKPLAEIFIDTDTPHAASIIETAVDLFPLIGIGQILVGLRDISAAALHGLSDKTTPFIYGSLGSMLSMLLAWYLTLEEEIGAEGVPFGQIIGYFISATILVYVLHETSEPSYQENIRADRDNDTGDDSDEESSDSGNLATHLLDDIHSEDDSDLEMSFKQ